MEHLARYYFPYKTKEAPKFPWTQPTPCPQEGPAQKAIKHQTTTEKLFDLDVPTPAHVHMLPPSSMGKGAIPDVSVCIGGCFLGGRVYSSIKKDANHRTNT